MCLFLRRAKPIGDSPASVVAQDFPLSWTRVSLRRSHLRTESLTFYFSICSLQSPSSQVLGANFSYRREFPRPSLALSSPSLDVVEQLVAVSFPLSALCDECRHIPKFKFLKKGVNEFQMTGG